MMAFYITIIIIYVVLLIASVVIWAINSAIDVREKKAEEDTTVAEPVQIKEDNVYLHVQNGKVTVLYDLPVVTVVKEVPAQPVVQTVVQEQPVAQPVAQPAAYSQTTAAAPAVDSNELATTGDEFGEFADESDEISEEMGTSVAFNASTDKKTFDESFMELAPEERDLYKAFSEYVLTNKDCKKFESASAITFKCKTDKVVRVMIKRGVIECHFMLVNSDMYRFMRESGAKNIKVKPVLVRLDSTESLELAKRTADITIKNYREEQYYRKQKRRDAHRRNN